MRWPDDMFYSTLLTYFLETAVLQKGLSFTTHLQIWALQQQSAQTIPT